MSACRLTAFAAAATAALTLAVAPPLAAQPAAAQPQARTIALTSYAFTPNALHLTAGQPVTLTFVNKGGKAHDFTAPLFFAHARILNGSAPGGRVELKGGARASITLVPTTGTYAAKCTHFLHSAFGMRGTIVVQ